MAYPLIIFTTADKLDSVEFNDGQIIFVKDSKLLYVDMDETRININAGIIGPQGLKGDKGDTPDLSDYATKEDLNNKVDKDGDKQLSTNDYTTEDKEKLNNIENKNLLAGTKDFSGNDWYFSDRQTWKIYDQKYNGFTVIYSDTAWEGVCKEVQVKAGQKYTLSAWARADDNTTLTFANNANSTSPATIMQGYIKTFNIDTNWRRYYSVYEILTEGTIRPLFEKQSNDGITAYICGLKLECGNKATDWSPAPEDLENPKYLTDYGANDTTKIYTSWHKSDTYAEQANQHFPVLASNLVDGAYETVFGAVNMSTYKKYTGIATTSDINPTKLALTALYEERYNDDTTVMMTVSSSTTTLSELDKQMIQIYADLILNNIGNKTIDDVPAKIKDKVQETIDTIIEQKSIEIKDQE